MKSFFLNHRKFFIRLWAGIAGMCNGIVIAKLLQSSLTGEFPSTPMLVLWIGMMVIAWSFSLWDTLENNSIRKALMEWTEELRTFQSADRSHLALSFILAETLLEKDSNYKDIDHVIALHLPRAKLLIREAEIDPPSPPDEVPAIFRQ